jgi:hypothetical protein
MGSEGLKKSGNAGRRTMKGLSQNHSKVDPFNPLKRTLPGSPNSEHIEYIPISGCTDLKNETPSGAFMGLGR